MVEPQGCIGNTLSPSCVQQAARKLLVA
ncbi:hypothetical protein OESDEN_18958 [Oesophagostomum dentatum]|uniref:Uncharacterized protein n=1 Tax=Oesophagostomum dentatum TaxID=61180 RepID=A0A0B1SBT1_OESDE|nr:hypothetical protein OESDEN_18958 [Oesophagostomum dentatum]